MSIGHYMYALFVAALICLIVIIVRLLFGDARRRRKLFGEQEEKLLKLYNSVETIMEEFTDQAAAAIEEMREIESRAAAASAKGAASAVPPILMQSPALSPQLSALNANPPSIPASHPPPVMKIDSSRIRAASQVLERAERMIKSSALRAEETPAKKEDGSAFQRIIDETTSFLPESAVEAANKPKTTHTQIIEMSEQGKSTAEIAKRLGVTQNEVLLVVGLGKKQ